MCACVCVCLLLACWLAGWLSQPSLRMHDAVGLTDPGNVPFRPYLQRAALDNGRPGHHSRTTNPYVKLFDVG